MQITVMFDLPNLSNKLLSDYGLDELDFTSSDTKSSKTLQILSLFVGQKKHSFTRSSDYGSFEPYHLVESMKTYMDRVNFYNEWEVQLLTAMILHTTRGVSDVKIEGNARRVASRTSDGTPDGRFDISYKSKKGIYLVELKILGNNDFKEGSKGSQIESWEIRKESSHMYDKVFVYDIEAVSTIQDALNWATVQAASYIPDEKVELYAGVVFVGNHGILLKTRQRPVYDIENDDGSDIGHKHDFNEEQYATIKKILKKRERK